MIYTTENRITKKCQKKIADILSIEVLMRNFMKNIPQLIYSNWVSK